MTKHQAAILYARFLFIAGLLSIVTGVFVFYSTVHNGRIAKRACERSRTYGPYLADLYERDLNPGPGVFRVMPIKAARAYRASIPTSC